MLQLTCVFIWAAVLTRVQGQGFQHPECGILDLKKDADEGVLLSHKGFGRCPYPAGMTCEWIIKGKENDENSRLRFQFRAYEMPKDNRPCPTTGLKFYERDSPDHPIVELCEGRVIPASIGSDTDEVVVRFKTSSTDFGAKGFILHIRRATCKAEQYMCKSDATCISAAVRCDKNKDCSDGSDEVDCAYHHGGPLCAVNYIQCRGVKSVTCIPASKACDGRVDCPSPDESDEVNCASLTSCPPKWELCSDTRYAPSKSDCSKTKK